MWPCQFGFAKIIAKKKGRLDMCNISFEKVIFFL